MRGINAKNGWRLTALIVAVIALVAGTAPASTITFEIVGSGETHVQFPALGSFDLTVAVSEGDVVVSVFGPTEELAATGTGSEGDPAQLTVSSATVGVWHIVVEPSIPGATSSGSMSCFPDCLPVS
jgi:hypothetical protein